MVTQQLTKSMVKIVNGADMETELRKLTSDEVYSLLGFIEKLNCVIHDRELQAQDLLTKTYFPDVDFNFVKPKPLIHID